MQNNTTANNNVLSFTSISLSDLTNLIDNLAHRYLQDRIQLGLKYEGLAAIKEAIADHEMLVILNNELHNLAEA